MFLAPCNSSLYIFFLSISIFFLIYFPTAAVATTDIICAASDRHTYCPVKCFTTNPVCGDDGVTYWCGCAEALCAGAKVAKVGFCEVGNNGGTGSVSAQALLLVHIVWLIIIGFSVLFGLF
ncbi:hypothetical protein ACOSP7_031628 [Xanthoceras sorbifolium]|uniref:Uncharacterized protein n=1 Tax=Xanthoceras sorbifolium TaxID=99658 RepID=A0ABQ8H0F0_9ROSI|nr:hypothetical protein JRO89_XS15G0001400 [Xanthoceras sorbifolium]